MALGEVRADGALVMLRPPLLGRLPALGEPVELIDSLLCVGTSALHAPRLYRPNPVGALRGEWQGDEEGHQRG